MSHAELAARMGGFMGLLTVLHFAVDFVLQSHAEAMSKHGNWKVRARHCLIYTTPFLPFLSWVGVGTVQVCACAFVLFWSHFFEDTYLPVYLWAKWVRRPPAMQWKVYVGKEGTLLSGPEEFVGRMPIRTDVPTDNPVLGWREELVLRVSDRKMHPADAQRQLDRRGFLEFVETPPGKILMIAIDQIVHIAFLLPIAWACAQVK